MGKQGMEEVQTKHLFSYPESCSPRDWCQGAASTKEAHRQEGKDVSILLEKVVEGLGFRVPQ